MVLMMVCSPSEKVEKDLVARLVTRRSELSNCDA